jgi:hypothetical protein
MCRKERFTVINRRAIKRLTELSEIPPRYSQAAFSFKAPWLTVLIGLPEPHCCLVACEFIYLTPAESGPITTTSNRVLICSYIYSALLKGPHATEILQHLQ